MGASASSFGVESAVLEARVTPSCDLKVEVLLGPRVLEAQVGV